MVVREFESRDLVAVEEILRSYRMQPCIAPTSFVVDVNGVVAATGGIHDMEGRSGWISSVAVAKSFRRKGLGTKIVQANIAYASRRGYGSVWLETYFWNVPFYRRFGFEVVRRPEVPPNVLSWRNQKHCCFMALVSPTNVA